MLNRNIKISVLPKTFLIASLIAIFNCIPFSESFGQEFSYRRIGLEDGLSQSSIMSIAQDENGFLWFATQDGLNRYDGYAFFSLKNEPFDSTSLSHNHVRSILIDQNEILWVGTGGGGVNVYEPQNQSFIRLRYQPEDSLSLSNDYITKIYEDSDGQIWIATQNGLNKVIIDGENPLTGKIHFERLHYNASRPRMSFPNNIKAVFRDHGGILWIGTRSGLFSINPDLPSDTLRSWFRFRQADNSWKGMPILEIGEDKNNELLICTAWGMYRFNPLIEEFEKEFKPWDTPESPNQESVNFFSLGSNGDILLGVEGKGIALWKYNQGKKEYQDAFFHLTHHPDQTTSLSDNWIYTVKEDRFQKGSWWIGTALGGITYIQERAKSFQAHYLNSKVLPTQSGTYIRSTLIDKKDNIWFSLERGIVKHNSKEDNYQYFHPDQANDKGLKHSVIYASLEDQKGQIWLGTYSSLYKILELPDGQTQFKQYPYPEDCHEAITFSLTEDKNGQILLGTATGLNVFDPETETFQGCSQVLDTLYGTQNGYFIMDMIRDKENHLWLATTKGLVLIKGINNFFEELSTAIPIVFRHNPDDVYSLRNDAINSLTEDNQGNIWLGTMNGLIKVSFKNNTWEFDAFTEKDGLANHVVYAVMNDSITHSLWLSTNNGISRLDLAEMKFDNYDSRDGLQGSEFNQGAFSQTGDGQLIFGGIGGYTRFYPSKIHKDPYPPKVSLTHFSGGDAIPRDLLNGENKEIELNYTENTFSIEFVGINYTDPKRNTYQYRLAEHKNSRAKWVDNGTSRQANITNLPPGRYLFEAKVSNADGEFSNNVASLQIKILPPFWRTIWFFLLLIIGIVGLFWLFHWYRVQVKVRRVVELERVRKSTAADFHDELGHKLTIISLFGEILKKQLNDSSEQILPHLNKIISTSNSLYYSMKDLLWVLDPEKDSMLDLVILLKDFGDELYDKTGISFRTEGIVKGMGNYILSMDKKRHIVLIFKEVMNNTLKHSSARNAALSIIITDHKLMMRFEDDGQGFNLDQANHGHGMTNLRERAEKLSSELDINSDDSGTHITLTTDLPKPIKKLGKKIS